MPKEPTRRYRGGGERNPYLPDQDEGKRYNYELVLDESHQKWRAGGWRANPEDFKLDEEDLSEGMDEIKHPDASRFELDLKKDLMGDAISLSALRELDYSPSYRPKGKLEQRITDPVTAPRRYDLLSGRTEAPPEDLAFLADAKARRERAGEAPVRSRAFDARRLDKPVDERRSEIIRMLPDEDLSKAGDIIDESNRRRERTDAELGRRKKENKEKRRDLTPFDEYLEGTFEKYMTGFRRSYDHLPVDAGVLSDSRETPEFEAQSRHWSKIDSLDPTPSEVLRVTETYVPEDMPGAGDEPANRDKTRTFSKRRPRKLSAPPCVNGVETTLSADYVRRAGIDPERIREIMGREYRGRWIPPALFDDNELIYEYFTESSRGNIIGEDFLSWAQRQRDMVRRAEERREYEQRIHIQRLKNPTPGRRGSKLAPPPGRRADPGKKPGAYDEMRKKGYEQGRKLVKSEAELAKKKEAERIRQYQKYQQAYYNSYMGVQPGQPGQPSAAQQKPRQNQAQGGYSGMYPDLFAGGNHPYSPQNRPRAGRQAPTGAPARGNNIYPKKKK